MEFARNLYKIIFKSSYLQPADAAFNLSFTSSAMFPGRQSLVPATICLDQTASNPSTGAPKKSGIFFPPTSIASGLMKPALTGAESFALGQGGRKGDGEIVRAELAKTSLLWQLVTYL